MSESKRLPQNYLFPKKKLGQHFLKKEEVLNAIVQVFIEKKKPGITLEIGPGQGALTFKLLEVVPQLHMLEFDFALVKHLSTQLQSKKGWNIEHYDALTYDYDKFSSKHGAFNLIGNLPYNISTCLIAKLLKLYLPCRSLLVMLQKEVAEQFCSLQKIKRGRLSVLAEYFCDKREYLFEIKPDAFFPQPKVDSALIYLEPKPIKPSAHLWNKVDFLLRKSFQKKRKTISKSLNLNPKQIEKLGIHPMLRPEKLSLENWISLTALNPN